ncbi:hypothetical protein AKG94_16040, partial [Vibrio harveyi]
KSFSLNLASRGYLGIRRTITRKDDAVIGIVQGSFGLQSKIIFVKECLIFTRYRKPCGID